MVKIRVAGWTAVFVLAATLARAHSFEAGAEGYAAFSNGASAVITDLAVVLLLLAAGIALGLSKLFDPASGFIAIICGAIAGIALSFSLATGGAIIGLTAAIVAGLWGAIAPDLRTTLIAALAAAVGVAAGLAIYAGHGSEEIPLLAYIGSVVLIWLLTAICAGITKVIIETVGRLWVSIAFRAASSWVVAIAVMTLAFTLRA